MINSGNLFADVPSRLSQEEIRTLLAASGVHIERIVSTGQASPPGFWYDQDEAEWVIVLSGSAELLIAGETAPRKLVAGDYVHLAAHTRHRVERTDGEAPTVWLAVHYREKTGRT